MYPYFLSLSPGECQGERIIFFVLLLAPVLRYKMARKNKNKNKKKVVHIHPLPQDSHQVQRRREQEKKIKAKNFSRLLKKLAREKKQKKTVASPKENEESFELETSCEESEHEEAIKESKNVKLHDFSSNVSGTSCITALEINQQKEISKTNKKTGNDRSAPKEKSLTKQKSLVVKLPRNSTERNKVGSLVSDTGLKSLQSNSLKYFYDPKLHEGEQDKTQLEAENNEAVESKTMKPTESMEFASNVTKNVPIKMDGKSTEDLANTRLLQVTNKNDQHPQKLDAKESKVKPMAEQEKKLLPLAMEKKVVVCGDIKLRSPNKDVTKYPYSRHRSDKTIIALWDDNIKISIHVNQGSQVVCKSRKIPEVDVVENGTREGQATARPDVDIKSYSEKYDKTVGDTKCESSNVSEFSSKSFQTKNNKVTDNSTTDIFIDSEQHGEPSTGAKRKSSSICKLSKEDDSSGIISVQEELPKIRDNFRKDCKSAFKKYEARNMDYIKRNLLNSSKM